MKIIGITGGMGSGKSIVAKILAHMGIPVYSADDRAKFLVENQDELKRKIIALLGNEAYTLTGKYNRSWVANQVFQSPALLMGLNQLIHPAVKADFQDWVHHQTGPYVAKEAALMNPQEGYDAIWVVTAPIETRIQRIQRRDPHRSLAQIEAILAQQADEAAFLAMATHQIKNDSTSLLVPQILTALAT